MDAATIPAEIVAVGDALTTELAAWTRAQPNATLADHEQAVLGITRQVMAAGLWTACPNCGTRRRPYDRARVRQVLTACGPVRLVRPYHYCGPCRRGWAPIDRRLGLAPRAALGPGAVRGAAHVGAATMFRAAAALLAEIGGLGVETVRTHAEQASSRPTAASRAARLRSRLSWRCRSRRPPSSPAATPRRSGCSARRTSVAWRPEGEQLPVLAWLGAASGINTLGMTLVLPGSAR